MPPENTRFVFSVWRTVRKDTSVEIIHMLQYQIAIMDRFFKILGAIAGDITGSLWLQKNQIKDKRKLHYITETKMQEHHKGIHVRQTNWYRPWGILSCKIKLAPSDNSIKSECLCLQMGCNGACLLYTLSWLNSFSPLRSPLGHYGCFTQHEHVQ